MIINNVTFDLGFTKRSLLNCIGDKAELSYINLEDHNYYIDDEDVVRELEVKGNALVFPYEEELYVYNKVMGDYLNENDINIPSGKRTKEYLYETGRIYDFYGYLNKLIIAEFDKWCHSNNVEFNC